LLSWVHGVLWTLKAGVLQAARHCWKARSWEICSLCHSKCAERTLVLYLRFLRLWPQRDKPSLRVNETPVLPSHKCKTSWLTKANIL
jgi:hypothetical protein